MTARKKARPKADGIPVYCSHTAIVATESLVPNPRNPYEHPDEQVALLAKIVAGQGWRNPIVVSARSGFIVKGHCRLMAAQLLDKDSVPVDVQEYASEAAEHADLIADNRLAELAEVNRAELKDLIETVDTGEIDLDFTGHVKSEIEALMTAAGDLNPDDYQIDPDEAGGTGKAPNVLSLEVPLEHVDTVARWLANGEKVTAEGMGRGVMKRCGLE